VSHCSKWTDKDFFPEFIFHHAVHDSNQLNPLFITFRNFFKKARISNILSQLGPVKGLIIQATGQKIIVYVSIVSVMAQSGLAYRHQSLEEKVNKIATRTSRYFV
jgi:hypothetical protein